MDVEKLIECVRAHVCLYDLSDKHYKNAALKNEIWESIGRELNRSGEAVKQKWKTIRDGYTKYKKQPGRRNVVYTWASQMAFLDHCYAPRSNTNVFAEIVVPSPPRSPSQFSSASESSPPPSPAPEKPALPLSEVSLQSQIPNFGASILGSSSRNLKRPSGHAVGEDHLGRVLQFLNAKKRKKLDLTDNLFLCYADTFKKFPPKEQAFVKLELAKLFANIELRLLDD